MIDILLLIAPFFALIALGYGAGRLFDHPEGGLVWLNVFLLYIALPALFFQLLSKTPVEELASPGFVATTTAATFVTFALGFAVAALRRDGGIATATIQGFSGAYGNIGYMGPAMAVTALGPLASVPVALIFCFDNILHFTMAPLLMALAGGTNESLARTVGTILRRIFTHPFILATLAGVLAAIVRPPIPEAVDHFIQLLAEAAAPCALFAMGVTLALRRLRRVPVALSYLVPLKLVVHPLLIWLLLGLAGDFDPVWVQTAVLMACLPTAANVFVIAQQYGVWVERASATILVTTVVSAATVPMILFALLSGLVPTDPF